MVMIAQKEKWHRHINPDGSKGGWVPDSADIHPDAFIGVSALINPNAKLDAGGRVLDGEMLTSDGEIVVIGRDS